MSVTRMCYAYVLFKCFSRNRSFIACLRIASVKGDLNLFVWLIYDGVEELAIFCGRILQVRWPRLFGQFFRFDKWNVCRG